SSLAIEEYGGDVHSWQSMIVPDRRDNFISQNVECSLVADPDIAIGRCRYRPHIVSRKPLGRGVAGDRNISKIVESSRGCYPNVSLGIFKKALDCIAR